MMEQRQTNNGVTLTLNEYRDIGALEMALSAHADEVMKNDLTPEQQRIAQTLFRRLTERVIGRGDRRRPTTLGDVAEVAGVSNDEVAAVVEKFRQSDRSFLTPPQGVVLTPDTIVDITHESLITLWHTLDEWVDDEARSAAAYDRLKKTAQDWPRDAELLAGINLERAQEWRSKQQPTFAWARRYGTDEEFEQTIKFLDASEREWAAKLKREADRERIEQENEIKRQKLEARARVALRLQLLTAALAVVTLWSIATAVYARRQTELAHSQEFRATAALAEARQQRQEAEHQRQKALEATKEVAEQKFEAETFAEKAKEQAELALKREKGARLAEARAKELQMLADIAKADAVAEKQKALELADKLTIAEADAKNKAEEAIATAKDLEIEKAQLEEQKEQTEEALRLARETQAELNVELKNNLLQSERTLSTQAAFSADASRIFTFSRAEGPSVWNTAFGWPVKKIKAGGNFLSAAFSRDGGRIVTAAENGDIVLTDLSSQTERRLQGFATKPSRVILSADARRLAVLDGATGSAKIVDLISEKTLASVSGTWSPIVNMSFSDDGKQLAVIALDGESKLVQLRRGEQISTASLTESSCLSSSLDLVNFYPRPDLRAKLSLSTDCQGTGMRAEEAAARGLTPGQTAQALGPAADDPKAADPGTKRPNSVDNTLTKKDNPSDPVAKATPTPSAIPSAKTPLDAPVKVVTSRRLLQTISLSVEQRQKDGSFSNLAEVKVDKQAVTGGTGLTLLELLRVKGISDDVIRKISASINSVADKLVQIKGDTPKDIQQRHKMLVDLLDLIMVDLGLLN